MGNMPSDEFTITGQCDRTEHSPRHGVPAPTSPRSTDNIIYLRPSDMRYTKKNVVYRFQDRHSLDETFQDLLYQKLVFRPGQLPLMTVTTYKHNWYTVRGNRRLLLMKKFEDIDILKQVKVRTIPPNPSLLRTFTTQNDGRSVEVLGCNDMDAKLDKVIREWESSKMSQRKNRSRRHRREACVLQ